MPSVPVCVRVSSSSSSSSFSIKQRNNKSNKTGLKKKSKFTIDCNAPGGKILDVAVFEKFLHDRIKVDGKAGNLGTSVTITRDKNRIVVQSVVPMSKRYMKYLTKKYLKKKQIRDFLRVVSTSKNVYTLKYFATAEAAMEEETA
ncbi:S60 ribosomal protein L22 [Cavenderia fasciculata]|uniref:S60 ribosomal protein L22 n=1 Tax=Cavenderia fasciculata TaxID=261658 RepID=F4Q4Z2_CACFS|nr:S60 ribosomal protein L22 [Cavenderia fasciculata]EGG17098.1 S60 ribosomal protein L22 [Cavenderia fasciculata]|eukprot:XP_004355582.1 S60 ribosomal protein L22 [Cavenderia fasciculata]